MSSGHKPLAQSGSGTAGGGSAPRLRRTGRLSGQAFSVRLQTEMRRAGDSVADLLALPGAPTRSTLQKWRSGFSLPGHLKSRAFLVQLERRYGLAPGELLGFDRGADAFPALLVASIGKHGDTLKSLSDLPGAPSLPTIGRWLRGESYVSWPKARAFSQQLERRYDLKAGVLVDAARRWSLAQQGSRITTKGFAADHELNLPAALLNWHLPEDFAFRSDTERDVIARWLKDVFETPTSKHRDLIHRLADREKGFDLWTAADIGPVQRTNGLPFSDAPDTRRQRRKRPKERPLAPPRLQGEWDAVLRFKTGALTPLGYERLTSWTRETASGQSNAFGLLFAFIAAKPNRKHRGLAVGGSRLSLALLIHPRVMEAYLSERMRHRGFANLSDVHLLMTVAALFRARTGWMAQTPSLASRLSPIADLVSSEEIDAVQADWAGACEAFVRYAETRSRDLRRFVSSTRDPLDAVTALLVHPRPLSLYRRIPQEVLRWAPDEREDPFGAALACQAALVVRLAMQTGFRQRCLRQLLVAPKGRRPRSLEQLTQLRRGELQWDTRRGHWHAVVPRTGFKNAASPVFANGAYIAPLPDPGPLNDLIEAFLGRHRKVLIGRRGDPGTLFVNPVEWAAAEFTDAVFYQYYRAIIAQYGVYNPFTGRGAVPGIKPHGSHCVRALVATHVLGRTGSFDDAAYAIQDTVGVTRRYYARFVSVERAAIVSDVLESVWRETDWDDPTVSATNLGMPDLIDAGAASEGIADSRAALFARSRRAARFGLKPRSKTSQGVTPALHDAKPATAADT